jgi:hypothetical protein
MNLKMFMGLLASKNGDELCVKVEVILQRMGLSMIDKDGSYKDVRTLLCEVAEVMNREK